MSPLVDQGKSALQPGIEPDRAELGGLLKPGEGLFLPSETVQGPGRGVEGLSVLGLALGGDLKTPERARILSCLEELQAAAEPLGRDVSIPGQLARLEQRPVDLRILDTPPP